MSEKKVFYCDVCGAKLPENYDPTISRIYIPVGLDSDPAGGASTVDSRPFDICHAHLARAINELLKEKSSFGYNAKILNSLQYESVFTLTVRTMNLDGSRTTLKS